MIWLEGTSDWYRLLLFHRNRFCRLEEGATEESNYRLLRYLATIHGGKLTDRQISDLKPANQDINDFKSKQINDVKEKKVFYSESHGPLSATELLLPGEDMRKLGLPILALRQNDLRLLQNDVDTSSSFRVDQFIESLGIQKDPTLDKIIKQAASDKPEIRRPALQYLLSNLESRYNAYQPDVVKDAFIPTKCGSLAHPNEVPHL